MQLPIMASPEDVSKITKYLSTKVSGATIEDAKAAMDKRLWDGRKVYAYITWGIVSREGDKLKLSDRGKRLAKAQDSEEVKLIYREIIWDIEAYQTAMQWLHYRGTENLEITNVELASYWHENSKFDMADENDNTMKDRAVCFFRICTAAGFGTLFVGRKGLPTRLKVNAEEIANFVEANMQNDNTRNDILEHKEVQEAQREKSTFADADESQKQSYENEKKENNRIVFPIAYIDGRRALLEMPQNTSKDDAQYVYDMLHLILSRQYGLDN